MNHEFIDTTNTPDGVFVYTARGIDKLTLHKLKATLEQCPNMKVTGLILMDQETGQRTLMELSAVRRLEKDAMWELMHPSNQPTGLIPKDAA